MNAPLPDPLVTLEGVSVRFGEVEALKDVNLAIRPGEVVALVGPNGCGKTTLLRVLHGLLAHEGERRIGLSAASGRRLVQGMVYQRPFLLRLSVRNNLRLALWLGGAPRDSWTQRIDEALGFVGLSDLGERSARALSGGQQQRLALARAWVLKPDILFLDEPTAALDPGAKHEIEALLAALAAQGATLVLSTHNLGQAKRLARRVVYLEAGRVVVDEPTELFFDEAAPGMGSAGRRRLQSFLKGELTWTFE